MPVPVLSPGHASPLTFPPIGRLPSAISAAGFHQFCSRHRRYYAAVRLLTSSATASSPRLPVVAHIHQSGLGEMRPPRFRRVPFIRNGVSDHGRAVAPRVTVRNMLPSTLSTASASATLSLSRLNIPLRMIAVYASRPPSPTTTQHSLQGGTLLPYPRRTFTGWNAPASPGALITDCPKSADMGGGNPAGQGQGSGAPSGTDFMRHCLAAARAVGEKDQQHRRGQGEAGPRGQTA
jgi:hypothetical protein